MHKKADLQFVVRRSFIKYIARGLGGQGWHYSLSKPDPDPPRPQPLSLTLCTLQPLSAQHLISPLNLGLTRSFGSKGLPLCLQSSSTNGARRRIEKRWRVPVSVKRQHRPRMEKGEPESEVRVAARGLRCTGGAWGASRTRLMCLHQERGALLAAAGLLTLSCGSDRLFTPPLIKINGPSLLLGSLSPIHLSTGVRLPQWPSRAL